MNARSFLIPCVLASAVGAPVAEGCDPVPATAKLARGVCALESIPDGVRVRTCTDGASWTVAAPPVLTGAVPGEAGGVFRGMSADSLVSDGAFLWMGLSERHGCSREPRGLVRYDPKRDTTYTFRGTDAGPCGFLVQDLLLRDDTLWVATDLGVSRLRLSPEDWDEWTHYAVSSDGAALEETACGSLLAVVAEAAGAPGGEELARWLAEFRPRFVKRLGRGMRPASPKRREAE